LAQFLRFVCACLEASIHGKDFPPASAMFFSAWEVSFCLSNLSANPLCQSSLLDCGLQSLVARGLDLVDQIPEFSMLGDLGNSEGLVRNLLTITWQLSCAHAINKH
jgi:hypothetical protein